MRPSRAVYKALSSIIYPVFQKKISHIDGLEHLPTSGGFLLAANHVDWLDGFYIASAIGKFRNRPVYFLTKTNNYWWTTLTIQIPPEGQGTIITTAVDKLQRGRIICNFPEGVRSLTDTLAPYKTGTARMALLAGVPVIPLGIHCEPGRTMAQSIMNLASSTHSVTLKFGTPIFLGPQTTSPSPDVIKVGMEKIMRAIAQLSEKNISL